MNKDKLTLNIRDIALLKSNPKEYYDKKSYSHKPHLGSLPHDRRTNDPELLQERIDAIDERMADNNKKIDDLRNKINNTIEERDKYQKTVDELQETCDKQEALHKKTREYWEKRRQENKPIRKELRDAFKELSTDSMLETMPASDDGYDIEENFYKHFDNTRYHYALSGFLGPEDRDDILELADQIDKQWVYYDSGYSDRADEYMQEVNSFTDNIRDYAISNDCNKDQGLTDLCAEQNEIDPAWFTNSSGKLQEDRFKLIDSNKISIKECDDSIAKNTRALSKLETQQKDYAGERKKCTDKKKEVSDGK